MADHAPSSPARSFLQGARGPAAASALLALAAAAVFGRALGHGFLKTWDDRTYVVANPLLADLSWRSVVAAFERPYFYNYAPLHLLSYMADAAVWGIRPGPFIAVNVLLHVLSAVLLYLLLCRVGMGRAPALAAALLFVVHPVQVESVVWVSQRKTVLSAVFFLVALHAYVRSGDAAAPARRRAVAWGFALAAFLLALLSKATAVVFPAVALAYDVTLASPRRPLGRAIAGKLPFAAIAVVVGLVTIRSQSPEIGGGTSGWHGGSPLSTALTMLPVLGRYVAMVVWPTTQSPVYAVEIRTRPDLAVLAGALVLAGVVALAIACRRRRPLVTFGALTFLAALGPVSQVVPIVTLMNDRYLYLPLLGAAPLVVEAFVAGAERVGPTGRRLVAAALCLLVVRDAVAAARVVPIWHDDHALWSHAVAVQPRAARAHYQLAHALELDARFREAVGAYERGLAIQEQASELYFLGHLESRLGADDRAIPRLRRALQLAPGFWDARTALAVALLRRGQADAAIAEYVRALAERPGSARTHNDAAIAYATRGRLADAVAHFEEAVRLEPADAEFRFNLGTAYAGAGRPGEADAQLREAVRLAPANARFARALRELRASSP